MPSLRKSESARINGAKSRGPKTESGLKRSSQNALKHGLTSQTLVLPSEDPDEFHQLLTSYLNQFQPDGQAELDLIQEMVVAKWRLQRLAIIETQLYVESMEHVEEDADDPLGPVESLTAAFTRLANSNSFPFLQRVESRLERTYSRALRNLIQLQRLRQSPNPSGEAPSPDENRICTNEPTEPAPTNGYFAGTDPASAAITPDPTTPDATAPHVPQAPQPQAPSNSRGTATPSASSPRPRVSGSASQHHVIF